MLHHNVISKIKCKQINSVAEKYRSRVCSINACLAFIVHSNLVSDIFFLFYSKWGNITEGFFNEDKHYKFIEIY